MKRPLQDIPRWEEHLRHNYEAELRLMDIKLLCAIGAICFLVASAVVLWYQMDAARDRAEAAEQWQADAVTNLGPYYRVDEDGKLEPREVVLAIQQALADKEKRLAELEAHAAHLGNVFAAERADLRNCWAAKSFDEFAGPDPTLPDGSYLGGGSRRQEEQGPIRLEAK